ncbi:amidohydrolase family protein [Flaviaesturariibacter amylovorans]|uniref:Amidohydrolase family protein n=1 Tax=Flaviaesturariibacter amylovorans TaxID=1084520 RepID=A0ABP8GAP4_9BACT
MSFRTLTAPRIFDGSRFHTDTALVLAADGTVEALVPLSKAPGAEVLDGILTPGFVNCHCHLELSHMKGQLPEATGLVAFVKGVIGGRAADPEVIAAAIGAADAEMRRNGIMAVGDISNTSDTAATKRQSALAYCNFVEVLGWAPGSAEGSYGRALAVVDAFAGCGPAAIVPHASYTVSEALWERIGPGFAGKVISVHNQETPFEDEFMERGTGPFVDMYQYLGVDNTHHVPTGRSSLRGYFNRLSEAARRILVHNTFIPAADVAYALEQSPADTTFFCLCINANLYIERQVPPVELLRSAGAPIVLGTDSLASNWSLGIHDELRALRQHFPKVPLEEMLQWATLNGAKALNKEGELGAFGKGKRPGVLLLQEEDLSVARIA